MAFEMEFDEDSIVANTDADVPVDEVVEETEETETETSDETEETDETKEEETEEETEEEDKDDKKVKTKKKDEEEKEEDPFDGHRYTRPRYKDIVTKYPKLFNDFPQLKVAFFRERDLTKLYPTLDDAQTAYDKAEMYESASAAILSGNADDFIDLMTRSKNEDVLKSFSATFLPAIYKADKDGFNEHFVTPIISRLVASMKANGKKFDNDTLVDAAKIISKFVFDSEEEPEIKPVKIDTKKNTDQERFWQERGVEFQQQTQFTGYNKAFELIKQTIKPLSKDLGLNDKKTDLLAKEMFNDLDEILGQDSRYQSQIKSLWSSAKSKGFNSNTSARIIDLYLSRVKAVIPGIKARHLKELGYKASKKVETESGDQEATNRPIGSKSPSLSAGIVNTKQVDWSKTSERDYMDGKITYLK
jgi:hypothetical protein